MMRLRAVLAIAVLALAAACAKPHLQTAPEPPALDAPAPPPRVIAPVEPETPTVAAPQPAVPRPPAKQRPRDTSTSSEPAQTAKPETTKTEQPPAPKTDQPPESSTPTTGRAPSETLQIAPPANEGQIERNIQAQLGRASTDLSRVDYRGLNADGRSQYDTAKRFIEQAKAALRERNLVFAARLADKAATLAAVLVGR